MDERGARAGRGFALEETLAGDSSGASPGDATPTGDGATEPGGRGAAAGATTTGAGRVAVATPLPGSASEERLAAERQAELDRLEHVGHVLRFRGFMPFVLLVWIGFGVVDWTVVTYIAPGPFLPFLLLRGGMAVLIAAAVWWTRRSPLVDARTFRPFELGLFVAASATISGMEFVYGGITSPYFAGIMMTLLVRSIIVARPWRQGVVEFGLIALTSPAVLLAGGLFSAELRAQLGDAAARAAFLHNLAFIGGAVVFIVIGGHVTWSLRRQIFETRSIGRYRLRRCIGKGGMGEVWAAHDQTLKRDVALKILRPERVTAEWLQRFEREARATAELSHLHTVRVFDYGASDDGIWYLAMELLEGETLRARIEREGPLPSPLVRRIAVDVAGALAEAHGRGIVHRDVKPENLFVATIGGEHDVIKLLDFGLAKTEAADDGLTRSGWVGGTPAYMSPEAATGKPADPRADVYSLGATLYFALTGRPPFAATSLGGLINAHLGQAVEAPSRRVAGVPPDLEAVVLDCLAKDPAARPRDGAEVLARLTGASGRGRPPGRPQVTAPKSAPAP